jgi:hypothetical protein
MFFGFAGILSLALVVAVYGGISSICVKLLASICNTKFSFSGAIWLLIAVLIALAHIHHYRSFGYLFFYARW